MEDALRELKPLGSFRTVNKGGNVLFQGEIPRYVMIVRSGVVRAYTITADGEERTVSLHGKDDVLPLSWALGATTNSLFYYEAVSDSRIFQVSRSHFNDFLALQPSHTMAMLHKTATVYTSLLLRITGLEQSRAIDKVGFTLYYLLFAHGIERDDGTYLIDIRLSHSLFASLVGLTRESVAKNLKQLRDKGVIDYKSFTYTVNKSKLEAFLGEDAFRDLAV